jgi:hypothetical protein
MPEASALTTWLSLHWGEVLVGAVLIGLLSVVFNMNGRLGELTGRMDSHPSQGDLQEMQRRLRDEVDRSRVEMQRQVDRIEERFEWDQEVARPTK